MMLFFDGCCTIILVRFMTFQLGHFKSPAKTVEIDGCCTTFLIGAAAVIIIARNPVMVQQPS